jgi:hypothetical protein
MTKPKSFTLSPLTIEIRRRLEEGLPIDSPSLQAEFNFTAQRVDNCIRTQRKRFKSRAGVSPASDIPKGKPLNWDELETLDRPKRRKRIEEIIRSSERDGDRLKALGMLEELDRATSSGLGPKEPLTFDEKVIRLTRLMSAVGEEVSRESLKQAELYWKEEKTWTPVVIYDGKELNSPETPDS